MPTAPPRRQRPEIQGLRAVAVLLVVVYHLQPQLISGGYVGVDVFFAISGFLITTHLASQIRASGTVKLGEFWARRMRRLLPASLLVLAVSTIAAALVLPSTLWDQTARQIVASAVYVQNWALAADSVNYLAEGNAPTVAQHYWSLSVEEQFYLLWPLLIIAVTALTRRTRVAPYALAGTIAVLSAVSLTYSVMLTAHDPSRAYFVTGTRIWQFGLGALVALVASARIQHAVGARIAGWSGLAFIAWAGFGYDGNTPFPGWAALVPVVGALLIICAGDTGKGSASVLLSTRPLRFVGDISYSIYLWHWPLVVLVPYATGHDLTRPESVAVLATTLVLASVTTRFVENPLRRSRRLSARPRYTFVAAATAMAMVCAGGFALRLELDHEIADHQDLAATIPTQCLGPSALEHLADCPGEDDLDRVVASPAQVSRQNASPAFGRCQADLDATAVSTCVVGRKLHPQRTIAVVGDSHATHWLSALDRYGRAHDWAIRVYTRSSCPFTAAERVLAGEANKIWPRCRASNAAVLKRLIADHSIDLVVASSFSSAYSWRYGAATGVDALRNGLKKYVDALRASGKNLIVLRDVPAPKDHQNSPDCLAAAEQAPACETPRSDALPPDQYAVAARRLHVPVVNLTRSFCDAATCFPVIGHMVVYRDHGHLSKQYSAALAPRVGAAIEELDPGSPSNKTG